MKYNININQKAIIDSGFDIDLIDAAIIDYIKDFVNSPKTIKKEINGEMFFWIQYEHLIKEMPILNLNSKRSLGFRLEKLIKFGILKKEVVKNNSTYFKFGNNYDVIWSTTPCSENYNPLHGELQPPVVKTTTIKHNNIIYNKKPNKEENSFSLEGKNNKLSLSLNEVIEVWNSVKISGWKKYTFRPGTNIANNLISSYKNKSSLFTKEEFYKGLENYIKDIENREPQTSYGKHRFDLPTFFKQSNGLEKFIDL